VSWRYAPATLQIGSLASLGGVVVVAAWALAACLAAARRARRSAQARLATMQNVV
jgi:hypothetical protein